MGQMDLSGERFSVGIVAGVLDVTGMEGMKSINTLLTDALPFSSLTIQNASGL